MRRHHLLRMLGEAPPPADPASAAWARLIAEGREFELVTIREPFVVRPGDQFIGQAVFRTGQFEFEKVEAIASRLAARPIRVLVDVGANIGTVCVPAIRRGLAERAIAIEPDPDNFSLLTANVAINGLLDRVDLHQLAAGSSSGDIVRLSLSDDNLGDHRIATDHVSQADRDRAVEVTTATLDELAPHLVAATDLIHIDVQGFEAQVLLGASRLTARRIPLAVEFWPAGLDAHGGLDQLVSVVQPYRSFVDLDDPAGVEQPLDRLAELYERYAASGTHTDLLLT
jgi:FkbM family methyltransferase